MHEIKFSSNLIANENEVRLSVSFIRSTDDSSSQIHFCRNFMSAKLKNNLLSLRNKFVILLFLLLSDLQFPTSPKHLHNFTRSMRRSYKSSSPTTGRRTGSFARRWFNWLHFDANEDQKCDIFNSFCSVHRVSRACFMHGKRFCRRLKQIHNQQVNCQICCRSK